MLPWQPVPAPPRFLPLRTGGFEEAACRNEDVRDKGYMMGEWRERMKGTGGGRRRRGRGRKREGRMEKCMRKMGGRKGNQLFPGYRTCCLIPRLIFFT